MNTLIILSEVERPLTKGHTPPCSPAPSTQSAFGGLAGSEAAVEFVPRSFDFAQDDRVFVPSCNSSPGHHRMSAPTDTFFAALSPYAAPRPAELDTRRPARRPRALLPPGVMRFSSAGPSSSLEATRAIVEGYLASYTKHGFGKWAVALPRAGKSSVPAAWRCSPSTAPCPDRHSAIG